MDTDRPHLFWRLPHRQTSRAGVTFQGLRPGHSESLNTKRTALRAAPASRPDFCLTCPVPPRPALRAPDILAPVTVPSVPANASASSRALACGQDTLSPLPSRVPSLPRSLLLTPEHILGRRLQEAVPVRASQVRLLSSGFPGAALHPRSSFLSFLQPCCTGSSEDMETSCLLILCELPPVQWARGDGKDSFS